MVYFLASLSVDNEDLGQGRLWAEAQSLSEYSLPELIPKARITLFFEAHTSYIY